VNYHFYFYFCAGLVRPAKYYENDTMLLTRTLSKLLRIKWLLSPLAVAAAEQTLDAIKGIVQHLHARGKGEAHVALGTKG
jgi:hypothetical protein